MSGNNINVNNNSLCQEAKCSELTKVLELIKKPNSIDDVYNMCKNSPINHKCNLSTFNLHCDQSLCIKTDCEKIKADHGGIDGLIKKCGGCHSKGMQSDKINQSIDPEYNESLPTNELSNSLNTTESQDYNTFKCSSEKSNENWNNIINMEINKLYNNHNKSN